MKTPPLTLRDAAAKLSIPIATASRMCEREGIGLRAGRILLLWPADVERLRRAPKLTRGRKPTRQAS